MGTSNSFICFTTISIVKDLRNKTENTNPDAVLNGDIDSFIEAGF